jgi:pimeloyl-ACP methyl ester carboxylesterase
MAKRPSLKNRLLPPIQTPPPGWKNPLDAQQPLTSLWWLGGAFVGTLLFAVVCVYISFCFLFWQGQWQLIFKPARSIATTPASVGIGYDEVRFDATETGALQLAGWWIPAQSPIAYDGRTVLIFHDGVGSLSDSVPQLRALHRLGVNVFAFDYRGFGKSLDLHPSEKSTNEDADAAWRYLTETRHLSPDTIILDGVGLGAAIAAETALRHPSAPALIVEHPRPPPLQEVHFDPRARLLPIAFLLHDRFDPAKPLAVLQTPKLFLYPVRDTPTLYYENAAQPKERAFLATDEDKNSYVACLRDFLDRYIPRS